MSKYIDFILMENEPKTKVYDIVNKQYGGIIGQIKWFPSWRKYSFFPAKETVFEQTCLIDIIDFLNKLQIERKVNNEQTK